MSTVIKDWFLVEIYDANDLKHESEIVMHIAWGIVISDSKGRFNTGDFVCTSRIVELNEDGSLRTKSGTLYETDGSGKLSRLHIKDLLQLRKGFSPDEILASNFFDGELSDATHC